MGITTIGGKPFEITGITNAPNPAVIPPMLPFPTMPDPTQISCITNGKPDNTMLSLAGVTPQTPDMGPPFILYGSSLGANKVANAVPPTTRLG